MTDEEMKEWVDSQDYAGILRWWRFAPPGDSFFQGEMGKYYSEQMQAKKDLTPDNGVSASKRIDWLSPGKPQG